MFESHLTVAPIDDDERLRALAQRYGALALHRVRDS